MKSFNVTDSVRCRWSVGYRRERVSRHVDDERDEDRVILSSPKVADPSSRI